jgi:hypothetical protein
MTVLMCGPAKGTAEQPYRCICCQRTFSDIEQMAVSICWDCQFKGTPGCIGCGNSRILYPSETREPETEVASES